MHDSGLDILFIGNEKMIAKTMNLVKKLLQARARFQTILHVIDLEMKDTFFRKSFPINSLAAKGFLPTSNLHNEKVH